MRWRIERKAEAEEEKIRQKREAERKQGEREQRLAKKRVDHLLEQASAFHQAAQIRTFAEAVGNAIETAPLPVAEEELAAWKEWAMTQANRIDPVVSGAFRIYPVELNE